MNMVNVGCLLLLLYFSILDIRSKKFYIEPIVIISVVCAGIRLYQRPEVMIDILLGCLPGMMVMVFCLITKGAVGAGDAAVVTGLGIAVGWQNVCAICFTGLVLCGITGLLLIACGKANKKTELPFVPFLAAAFLIVWLYSGWS